MKFKYWLTSLTDISNAKKKLLHDCSITAEKLFFMPKNELFDILFFTDDDRKIILESRASYDVEKEWILFQQKDIGFVTMEDEAYPDKLRNIHNPPYSLFYIGALPDKSRKSVAIVGARGRSAYGCEVAKVLAAALSRQGIQIISGMARGIDRDAHMGCLEAGGNTYAVLGSGADTCYPKENRFLYDKIKVFGGIISEFMPGTDPQKMFFPMRNRIISGLSDIVVIVEAKKRSGSLITADLAMEQGKDVYVIPGRITDTLSTGLRLPQDDMSPTPAGINITGIISIMNLPALLTELSGIRPVSRPMKSITMPYMLAGTGNGSKYLSISPTNEIASMMRNCFNNFILYCISVIYIS